jgi:hypothetical protein
MRCDVGLGIWQMWQGVDHTDSLFARQLGAQDFRPSTTNDCPCHPNWTKGASSHREWREKNSSCALRSPDSCVADQQK